ncbi:hypothetical protein L209DRAFT_470698 [Thermothelomyces heterothallicus CBS 203.75]
MIPLVKDWLCQGFGKVWKYRKVECAHSHVVRAFGFGLRREGWNALSRPLLKRLWRHCLESAFSGLLLYRFPAAARKVQDPWTCSLRLTFSGRLLSNTEGIFHSLISNLLLPFGTNNTMIISRRITRDPLWRNWLARLTVNQEVGSSSLPGGDVVIFQH